MRLPRSLKSWTQDDSSWASLFCICSPLQSGKCMSGVIRFPWPSLNFDYCSPHLGNWQNHSFISQLFNSANHLRAAPCTSKVGWVSNSHNLAIVNSCSMSQAMSSKKGLFKNCPQVSFLVIVSIQGPPNKLLPQAKIVLTTGLLCSFLHFPRFLSVIPDCLALWPVKHFILIT